MKKILEAIDLSYHYGDGTRALIDVQLSIEEGQKVALVGPNGAGKSTLMLMFNAILRPTNGSVLFRDRPLSYDSRGLREIRRAVGMVFQNSDDQLFAPSVYQDVAFGPTNLGYPKEKVKRYVSYALEYVGLSGYERRPPHHLSGGEKKRVAIAGILAMEPDVMILDEPTSNLDPASSEEIMEMLDELNLGGKSIIISTHDVDLAYRWADEIVLMKEGGIVRRGTGAEVFEDSELIKDVRLKPPMVVELYHELADRGMVERSRPPRSLLELCDLLQKPLNGGQTHSNGINGSNGSNSNSGSNSIGRICICDVDGIENEKLIELTKEAATEFRGAMGSRAKLMAKRCSIPLDFTYGVIDRCILKAMTGRSSLIMTSGGMVEHSRRRIEEYCQQSGAWIKTEILK